MTVCNNKLECATSTPNLHHTPLRQPIHAYNTSSYRLPRNNQPQPQQNARGSNTLLARLLAPSLSLACPIRVEATAATRPNQQIGALIGTDPCGDRPAHNEPPLHVTLCAHGARMREATEVPKARACEKKVCAFLMCLSLAMALKLSFYAGLFLHKWVQGRALRPLSFAVFCGIEKRIRCLLGNWIVHALFVQLTRGYIHSLMHYSRCASKAAVLTACQHAHARTHV